MKKQSRHKLMFSKKAEGTYNCELKTADYSFKQKVSEIYEQIKKQKLREEN